MKAILALLFLSTSLSWGTFLCPRQCSCGDVFKCSIKDLRTLKAILPSNITRLDLSSSGISDVPDGTFENFTSLRYLSLANNSISRLSRNSFKGLRNLQELHLQNNGKIHLDENVFQDLPSLKLLHLQGNKMNGLNPGVFNLTRTINVSRDTKKESIHCHFRKKPLSECIGSHVPKCQEALQLKGEEILKFKVRGCARAKCTVKESGKILECYMSSGSGNDTSWSILGDNSAVKLALWTFGLLAVTSNFLVLLTLVCNSDARKSALCVFVMNLLLGNILIGSYIVVLTVSDTITYGKFLRFGEGRWESSWCVPLFFIKTIGLALVILSLVLLAVERMLVTLFNAPHHLDCCRSVGYVVESWLFATVVAVVLWTKSSNWGYICSTHANSKDFSDISKGIKISLAGICITLVFVYIYILCRQKGKDHDGLMPGEYRTTVRMLLLLISTFFCWVLPYMVMVFMVPIFISVTLSMQTLAISMTVNACLHPFIYSYDNEHLENLYSALSCKRDSCLFLPVAVQGQCYQPSDMERHSCSMELEPISHKKSLESLSVVEVKRSTPFGSETCTRLSPVTVSHIKAEVKRGFEISKAEGAVIIRNKSPTESKYDEDLGVVLVHSVPSSPETSSRDPRAHIDEHSECGTVSSDTNVTWISSDCPSNTHQRIGDGNSTTSSHASSIPLGKSATSPYITRKRLSSVKSDSERSEEGVCDGEQNGKKSPLDCMAIQRVEEEDTLDEKTTKDAENKRERRMSPVEIICRVLSPKARKKRPKTVEGIPPEIKHVCEGKPQYKRSKSMVLGKDARNTRVREDALSPLPPVQLREKRPRSQAREYRHGVFMIRKADDGSEIQESIPVIQDVKTIDTSTQGPSLDHGGKDWDKVSTFLVIKPANQQSKLKVSNKEKKKAKSSRSLSEPVAKAKIRIYENPVADRDNNNKVTDGEMEVTSGGESVPTSPTRKLAKLEEGDTVPELPKGLKAKQRISTASTSSSTRLSSKSLEWDPSYAGEAYCEDEVMPPPPPPPPKIIAALPPSPPPSPSLSANDSRNQLECLEVRLDPANRYSLEWDPTGVQMRLSVISHDSTAGSNQDTQVDQNQGEVAVV